MELTQLKQFKVIAECENLTEASRRLYITQPSLSHSLKKLEDELGCKLFQRSGKKLILNEQGKKVHDYSTKIIEMANEMVAEIGGNKNLKISSSALNFLMFVIPEFAAQHDEIEIIPQSRNQNELSDLLLNKECDAVVSVEPICDKCIVNVKLCTDYSGVTVLNSDPLAQKEFIELEDIEGLPFITFPNYNYLTEKSKEFIGNVKFYSQMNQSALTSYGERSNKLSLMSTLSALLAPENIKGRTFIPFDKKYGVKSTYYFCYPKKSNRMEEIKKLEEFFIVKLAEYNKIYKEEE